MFKYLLSIFSLLIISKGVFAVENTNITTAVFAGGCFWCVEADFEKVDGVTKVESGYAGGDEAKVDYQQVSSGQTGHTEVVMVYYDNTVISYSELLDIFWKSIDPTVKDRQFCDIGSQYRTGIYYQNNDEKELAEKSKKYVEDKLGVEIYTEIEPVKNFNLAEEYHQDYYKKNPVRYNYYRYSCGRDEILEKIWSKTK